MDDARLSEFELGCVHIEQMQLLVLIHQSPTIVDYQMRIVDTFRSGLAMLVDGHLVETAHRQPDTVCLGQ